MRPWPYIAFGTALFSVGDVAYNLYARHGATPPLPSWADVADLSGYLFIAAGIIGLMPEQRGRSRILGLLDAAIITLAAGSYIWIFVVEPAVGSSGDGTLAKVVGGAYPVMDLLILSFLVRLILSGALAQRAILLLGGGMFGAQVPLRLEVETGLGLVTIDPNQLEQIVLNMAVNARDAMPNGGLFLISLRQLPTDERQACFPDLAAGDYLEISFNDEGHGMSEATQARVFEPFFTTKEVGKGTGLGLATSYGIIENVGGSIFIESELGVGTTFRVALPLMLGTAVEPAAPAVVETVVSALANAGASGDGAGASHDSAVRA